MRKCKVFDFLVVITIADIWEVLSSVYSRVLAIMVEILMALSVWQDNISSA
jgi:hypothetical protein